jgi:ribosomal protein S18 acetylase RimI-like enzyme
MLIREYQKEDWQSVCKIYLDGRPAELRGSCDLKAVLPLEETPHKVELFSQGKKYVGVLKDSVVGFVCINDEEITFLYVYEAYQGQGIGRKLLQFGKKIAGNNAYLKVAIANTSAKELYSSEGFIETEEYHYDINGYPATVIGMELKAAG